MANNYTESNNVTCLNSSCPTTPISDDRSPALEHDRLCNTTYCIPMVILISAVSITGIVTNAIVVMVITWNKSLRKPTFTAIAALSICDFTFLLFRYVRYIVHGYLRQTISLETYTILRYICDGIGMSAGTASIISIVLLSLLRYVMLTRPIWSHVNMTNCKIIVVSFAVWCVSAAVAVLYILVVIVNHNKNPRASSITNFTITLFFSLVPALIILIFHILKARKLKESIAACQKNTTKQMSRIVTVILIVYFISTTPINVRDILIIAGYDYRTMWMVIYGHVGRLLLFLNFTINPFIYFVHSQQFRKYLECKVRPKKKSSSLTTSTSLSSGVRSSNASTSDQNKCQFDNIFTKM